MESNDMEADRQSQQFQKGHWNQSQQEKFIYGIMFYGKDWKKIQELISTRTGSQVRSHAQKFFIKIIKINKQRKKQKKKQKPYVLTQFQKDFLKYFKKQYISQETPQQIIQLLSFESNQQNGSNLRESNDNKILNKQAFFSQRDGLQNEPNSLLNYSALISILHQHNALQVIAPQYSINLQNLNNLNNINNHHNPHNHQPNMIQQQNNNEQSYLMTILRQNTDFLQSTHDFAGFIQFFNSNKKQKVQDKQEYQRNRKKSFHIPDQQQNEEKLKITLESIRKQMRNENQN